MNSFPTSPAGARSAGAISPGNTLVYPVTPSRISVPSHPVGPRSASRPASISELAERALEGISEGPKDLKAYLRTAQRSRDVGKEYVRAGDLEAAFVEFAKAATIVLEKLPTHRDYHTLLNESQRHNLGLNGQDILDNLSKIKPTLVERYERWLASQSDSSPSSGPHTPQSYQEDPGSARRSRGEPFPIQEEDVYGSMRDKRTDPPRRGYPHDDARGGSSDEEARRREGVEAARRRQADEYAHRQQEDVRRREEELQAREAAAKAARVRDERGQVYGPRLPDGDALAGRFDGMRVGDRDPQPSRNEDAKRREEDAARRMEDRRREEAESIMRRQQEADAATRAARSQVTSSYPVTSTLSSSRQSAFSQEQEGIARRQREADDAARAARQCVQSGLPVSAPPNVISSAQQAAAIRDREEHARRQREAEASARARHQATPTASSALPAPTAVTPSNSQYSFLESHHMNGVPIMPLESPTKYDDDSSTDASVNDVPSGLRPSVRREKQPERSPSKPPRRSPSYPVPVTTTSPPPPELGAIRYPSLMTKHQIAQGYAPSLESMFMQTMGGPAASNLLLFDGQGSDPYSHLSSIGLHGVTYPQMQHSHRQHRPHPSNGPSPARPPQPSAPVGSGLERITRADSKSDGNVRELKTVHLPRECLPRFLSIAAANTARNRETCGLLLGRDKGHKYVVSCLLIPKQHSTSDTCAMDEEELVLEFQEERNLITLGWIHTHPTQSCFMSSVDLHTHGGFQRMLPESFAVVCAPTSTPNYGIFRLTDPPGLQTILDCHEKEAFHPHPDLPIYTDADKGHVQMKDIGVEIVDLR